MLVQQILSSKPNQNIETISSSLSVSDAASILSSKRIGALIVSDDSGQTVAGMISERDIVRELGKRGTGCLHDAVAELMTKKIVTCSKNETVDAVLRAMTDGRFRHLPVMENGKLIGLISIGDAVQARLSEMTMENQALEGMIKGF
jgi:CBS domain-containing protein